MTFATGQDNCEDCLRILRRDNVGDSCYQWCYYCPHGVKIVGGKRVYTSTEKVQKQVESCIKTLDRELQD